MGAFDRIEQETKQNNILMLAGFLLKENRKVSR